MSQQKRDFPTIQELDKKHGGTLVIHCKEIIKSYPQVKKILYEFIQGQLKRKYPPDMVFEAVKATAEAEAELEPIKYIGGVIQKLMSREREIERERLHEQKKSRKPDAGLLDKLGLEGKKI